VRRALENAAVRKAAQKASLAQKAQIDRLCDALLATVEAGESDRAADWAYHGAIYDASGNPMFGQILTRLDEMFERSAESPFSRSGFGLQSFPLHRDLTDGIVAGDPDRAAVAINAIIDTVEQEIRVIIGLSPT